MKGEKRDELVWGTKDKKKPKRKPNQFKVVFPKKIRLMDKDYKIVFKEMYFSHGSMNYDTKTMLIDKDSTNEEQFKALWHEIGHWFADYFDLTEEGECFPSAFQKIVCGVLSQINFKYLKEYKEKLPVWKEYLKSNKKEV